MTLRKSLVFTLFTIKIPIVISILFPSGQELTFQAEICLWISSKPIETKKNVAKYWDEFHKNLHAPMGMGEDI